MLLLLFSSFRDSFRVPHRVVRTSSGHFHHSDRNGVVRPWSITSMSPPSPLKKRERKKNKKKILFFVFSNKFISHASLYTNKYTRIANWTIFRPLTFSLWLTISPRPLHTHNSTTHAPERERERPFIAFRHSIVHTYTHSICISPFLFLGGNFLTLRVHVFWLDGINQHLDLYGCLLEWISCPPYSTVCCCFSKIWFIIWFSQKK